MTDSLHHSLSDSVNGSRNPVEPFKSSRAPAEQGAGSREQGGEQGSIRSQQRIVALRDPSSESITATIRSINQAEALARLILDLRPEWNPVEVYRWALSDPRPWTDVVGAGINGARDRAIKLAAGLRYAGPAAPTAAQTYPTVREALADLDLCDHESRVGACPSCRAGGSS